ncbi:snf2 family helicase [Fusarium pseudoanthophilum]|uniref:Snf2 family helicase n=1 Tax=Fusarium pseudoanthophilum TaxID=48495 RepID=A0A8H5NQS3_9HYPO|nr:snf2 family helicase [Fusarium pseudoanthophilum]
MIAETGNGNGQGQTRIERTYHEVVNILHVAGFDIVTIRPSTKQSEKDEILEAWNNPHSGLQVFVANINNLNAGINMHECCHRGIFISWRLNMKVNMQCTGRLVRIGQKKKVVWKSVRSKICARSDVPHP